MLRQKFNPLTRRGYIALSAVPVGPTLDPAGVPVWIGDTRLVSQIG